TGLEVDIICYGDNGFYAIEVKRSHNINKKQLRGLKSFQKDYPEVTPYLVYGGKDKLEIDGISIIPIITFLKNIKQYLGE
ncbi:MAG: ATP-binding protein, partial [Cocleimonas sp.]